MNEHIKFIIVIIIIIITIRIIHYDLYRFVLI